MPEGRKGTREDICHYPDDLGRSGDASGAKPRAASPNVCHTIGLDSIQRNATGMLTVQMARCCSRSARPRKVDLLTISFHNLDGALHGVMFALPIGDTLT